MWDASNNAGSDSLIPCTMIARVSSENVCVASVTIIGPVVCMARYEMILMGENPFRGPLKGVGTENQDFSEPKKSSSKSLSPSALEKTGTLIILCT